MTGEDRFCPKCGNERQLGMSFCGRCGHGFDSAAPRLIGGEVRASDVRPPRIGEGGWSTAEAKTRSHREEANVGQVVVLSGVAWILAAAVLGYLAYVQWDFAAIAQSLALDASSYRTTAVWNLVSAALTAYFGAKSILAPSRRTMTGSAVWAAANVAWGAIQLGSGGTSALFALYVVLVAVAGILAFAGRSSFQAEPWRADRTDFH